MTSIAVLLLAAGTVAAWSGGNSDTPAPPASWVMTEMPASTPATAPAAAAEIVISGFSYIVPAAVAHGETITLRNEDNVEHTVTADGSGDPNMHATLTVR